MVCEKGGIDTVMIALCRCRFLEMLCIGHTLRFFTYISTSYPGTSRHCSPENVGKIKPPSPQTLYEVFIGRVALAPGANCGDLLFR